MSIQKKKYWGRIPEYCEDYEFAINLGKLGGHLWSIYAEPEKPTHRWRGFRIMVSGLITGRANYLIRWCSEDKRFSKCHDIEDLMQKRPRLWKLVLAALLEAGYIELSYAERMKL